MGAHRWSKTIAAYHKWSYIFDHDLPYDIPTTKSSLSIAMYIRDVISFAHEHNMKGKEWYKSVTVSATSEHNIRISLKVKASDAIFPTLGIFDLIGMHSSGELKGGLVFTTEDSVDDIRDTLRDLGITISTLDSGALMITTVKG